jgi:virginiamycin B lyase
MLKKSVLVMIAIVGPLLVEAHRASDSVPVALTGLITSKAEGRMEGVLVSAKREGSTVTVTVVSNKEGRYAFRADRLKPGTYHLSVRAARYDLNDPGPIEVVGRKSTSVNLRLHKTRDLASQLTPAEWLMSIPGTQEQKDSFYDCQHCHNLTLALRSKYNATQWLPVIQRMRHHAPPGSLRHPVDFPFQTRENPENATLAEYLASINLSSRTKWNFELNTLPRPKGEDTRVIVTEYDLPRPDSQPHDAVIDAEGMVWYVDFLAPYLGRLDPQTGEVKEWEVPVSKPGFPEGSLDLELDREGNLWFGRLFQAAIAKFDKKTQQFQTWNVPAPYNNIYSVSGFVGLAPDGKVWFNSGLNRKALRLDPKTGQIASYSEYPDYKPTVERGLGAKGYKALGHLSYGLRADSVGNYFFADMAGGTIGKIDAQTGEAALHPTPTPNSGPRRMHIDPEDKLWFAEYYGLKLGMFDTKTGKFREWPDPTPWDGPYDVVRDKDGKIWTAGMSTDLITRLDPQTGHFVRYLLPNVCVNIRRVEVDNSTTPVTFWVGENHQGKIAKVEPLE